VILYTTDALPEQDPKTSTLLGKTLLLAIVIFGFVQLTLGVVARGI
jgi:hypothetical protein